jgi:hypothetical protein
MAYIRSEKKYLLWVNGGVLAVFNLLILINLFGGFFFYFDEQNQYIHGKYYLCLDLISLYYLAVTFAILLINGKCFAAKQKFSIVVFMVLSMAGPIVQLAF